MAQKPSPPRKPCKPIPPEEFLPPSSYSIQLSDGDTLAEILAKIPKDIQYTEVRFDKEDLDDYRTLCTLEYCTKDKIRDPLYEKQLADYNKKLLDYETALVGFNERQKQFLVDYENWLKQELLFLKVVEENPELVRQGEPE